jgi:hypothetical protein
MPTSKLSRLALLAAVLALPVAAVSTAQAQQNNNSAKNEKKEVTLTDDQKSTLDAAALQGAEALANAAAALAKGQKKDVAAAIAAYAARLMPGSAVPIISAVLAEVPSARKGVIETLAADFPDLSTQLPDFFTPNPGRGPKIKFDDCDLVSTSGLGGRRPRDV